MRTKQIAALILVLQICTCGIQSAEQPVSALADLAENSPNAVAWILSPLSGTLPSEIRQNLIFLREDLLDEGKTKTEVERVPYRVGYSLCASLLAALDERDAFAVRAQLRSAQVEARTQPIDRSITARRNYKMSWPQYERELEQREDVKRQEAGITTLRKEQAKVEWLERAAMLRRALDGQYAAFRKELREAGIGSVAAKTTDVLKPTQSPDHESKESLHAGSSKTLFTNSLGMKFTALPGDLVLICIHETRVKDYQAFVQRDVSRIDTASTQDADFPITNVSWLDAKEFCEWLSKKEQRIYRLPTDREWSVAAEIASFEDPSATPDMLHGKIKNIYPWGASWPPPPRTGNFRDIINGYVDNWSGTAPVMSFISNQTGLFDLAGNVSEWCEDKRLEGPQPAIARGGNFALGSSASLNASGRSFFKPDDKSPHCGFRCVVEIKDANATRDPR